MILETLKKLETINGSLSFTVLKSGIIDITVYGRDNGRFFKNNIQIDKNTANQSTVSDLILKESDKLINDIEISIIKDRIK